MSIQIITTAWLNFQKIPKQKFTDIIIQALAMTRLISDFDKNDLLRLEWLRDNTHKDVKRSMFELDRYVDETHGRISNKHISFPNGKTLSQDRIQNYLCLAVSEIYQIIYSNFKDYKVEEKLNLDQEETNEFTEGWV